MKTKNLIGVVLISFLSMAEFTNSTTNDDQPVQEFDPDSETTKDTEKKPDFEELDDTLEEIDERVKDKSIMLEEELNSTLKRIENIVDTGMASIDDETIRKYWREGKEVERDIEFERDVTYYGMRKVYDFPCKSVDFVFSVKDDFDEFNENAEQYPLCFLIYFDLEIKEFILDLVLRGVESILASGYSNPVSTFFSNAIIIEGPLSIKKELFGSIYDYYNTSPVKTELFKEFFEMLKKLTFIDDGKNDHSFVRPENLLKSDSLKRTKQNRSAEEHEDEMSIKDAFTEHIENFAVRQSTSMTFFLHDVLTNTMHNDDIYLSAYDFIQPDVNLINEPESMNPGYVNEHFKEVLEKELEKFKEIKENQRHHPVQTIYHIAYGHYVDKSIKVLCTALFSTPDC